MKTGRKNSILNRLRNNPIARFKLVWPDPRKSLRSKISLFVCAVTLLAALMVTFISTHSVRNFLYSQIEYKLPALLQRTAEKVELLYQQRMHEVGVFAGAHTLVESMTRFSMQPSEENLEEIRQFLYYLFENSPQFESLFVLSASGAYITGVGETIDLESGPRARLSGIKKVSLDNIFIVGHGNLQVVSAPIRPDGDSDKSTLHAVINLESLREQLQNWELSADGTMFLVDAENRYIAANRKSKITGNFRGAYEHSVDKSSSTPVLQEYKNSMGQDVVGGAIYVPKIDGALIVEEPYHTVFAPVQAILQRTLTINLAIVFLFAFIAYRITVSISRPIDALSKGVRRISAGEKNVAIAEPESNDEIGVLTQAFNSMTHRLAANSKELERLSITDGLTQLYNYRYFQQCLSQEVERVEEGGRSLALVLCDIDNFKDWNDQYGHSKGDEILSKIALILKSNSRGSDLVARYGGDEFVILAPSTNLEGALALAEKLRSSVASANILGSVDGLQKSPTISTGVSVYSGSREALFEEADRALYCAKNSGRDCVRAAGVMG